MDKNVPLPSSIKDYVDAPLDFFDLLDEVIPTEVCHYTSKETAIEYILKNREIRLGRLGLTNDPRESKRWTVPNIVWSKESSDSENAENDLMIEDEVNRILKEEWRVLCVTCHSPTPLMVNRNMTIINMALVIQGCGRNMQRIIQAFAYCSMVANWTML